MIFMFVCVLMLPLIAVWLWQLHSDPAVWIDRMSRAFDGLVIALGDLFARDIDWDKTLGGLGLTVPVESGGLNGGVER